MSTWSCPANVSSVVETCCNNNNGTFTKINNGTIINSGCKLDNDGYFFSSCFSSTTASRGSRAECTKTSHAIKNKVNWMVFTLVSLAMFSATANAELVNITAEEATGGYQARIPSGSFIRLKDGDTTILQSEVGRISGQPFKLTDNFFEDKYGINKQYSRSVVDDIGITGRYTSRAATLAEYGYGNLTVLTSPPTNSNTTGAGKGKLLERDTYIARANAYTKIGQEHIETGGIAMSDFVRSVCYDRCSNNGCDQNNELVWTTNYISGRRWYRNVRLAGRAQGSILFGWSDQIKWDSRNMMCEMVKPTIENAQVMTAESRYGCDPSCTAAYCNRAPCSSTSLDMWSGPKRGSMELWTKWSDGGESMAMWFTWEVNQVGSWKPNVCTVVGIFLGFLGYVPGLGYFASAGGLATSTFCGT